MDDTTKNRVMLEESIARAASIARATITAMGFVAENRRMELLGGQPTYLLKDFQSIIYGEGLDFNSVILKTSQPEIV